MSELEITGPRSLEGKLRLPGDKSISHRALLLAALADGTSTLRGLSGGEDVAHTQRAVVAMGAVVEGTHITGGEARLFEPRDVIEVGNSGTAIRLLAGWCAARPWLSVLNGDESVASRPMDRVVMPLRVMGAAVDGRGEGSFPPLVIRGGGLSGIDYVLPVPSAQVKGAVLLAGLSGTGETVVRESVAVRAHTEELLALAGADVTVEDEQGQGRGGRVVRVRPSSLRPLDIDIPGDPSAAAFWIVAACVCPGSDLVVEGVYLGRARAGFLDVLHRMGADIDVMWRDATTADIRARSGPLVASAVGGEEVPGLIDEIPVLVVAAAVAKGTTVFSGAAELKVKEIDRVAGSVALARAMGAHAESTADGLVVEGRGGPLAPGRVSSGGDHRMAMAGAVAALAAGGRSVIEGWEAVATSYPGFAEELTSRCAS